MEVEALRTASLVVKVQLNLVAKLDAAGPSTSDCQRSVIA